MGVLEIGWKGDDREHKRGGGGLPEIEHVQIIQLWTRKLSVAPLVYGSPYRPWLWSSLMMDRLVWEWERELKWHIWKHQMPIEVRVQVFCKLVTKSGPGFASAENSCR